MPGKTKHYQTLFLPESKELCLMDCPGLVFPSFLSSKAEMLTNGILPVDTLRDYLNPIALIIKNIPRKVLEMFYKIELPDIFSATQFLQLLASSRGYITGRSLPDEARTSKMILKDYTSGKLLFCHLRPDYNKEKHGFIQNFMKAENYEYTEEEKKKQEIINEIPADFDDNFEKIDIKYDDLNYLGKENQADNELNEKLENKEISLRRITKDMRRALKFAMKRGDVNYFNIFFNIISLPLDY
jgi:large subunit GTPase 1